MIAPRPEKARRFARAALAAHLATVFFGIALSNIFLGMTLLAIPFARVAEELRAPRVRPLLLAVAAWLAALTLAVAGSIDSRGSAGSVSELFNLSTLLLVVMLAREERVLRRVVGVVIAVAVGLGVLGSAQLLMQGEAGLSSRIKGSLSHYMTFSGILVIGGSFLLAHLLFRRGRWLWMATIPIVVALVASLTRSAWAGLIVALVLLLLLRSKRLMLVALPGLAILFAVLAPPTARERMVSIFDPTDVSNYDRLCMVQAGLEMFLDRPITGIGPEMVERVYPIYRVPSAPRLTVPHLHNAPLQILAEMGMVGFLAWLLLLGVGARAAWRRYWDEGGRSGPNADLWLGALAALAAFVVAGMFEDNWGDAEVRRLALVALAVPFCAAVARGAEPPDRSP